MGETSTASTSNLIFFNRNAELLIAFEKNLLPLRSAYISQPAPSDEKHTGLCALSQTAFVLLRPHLMSGSMQKLMFITKVCRVFAAVHENA